MLSYVKLNDIEDLEYFYNILYMNSHESKLDKVTEFLKILFTVIDKIKNCQKCFSFFSPFPSLSSSLHFLLCPLPFICPPLVLPLCLLLPPLPFSLFPSFLACWSGLLRVLQYSVWSVWESRPSAEWF